MKKVLKYILCAGVISVFAACAPKEFDKPALGPLPDFNSVEFEAVASTDPTTPYLVYLRAKSPGVVPIWEIDGATVGGEQRFNAPVAGSYTVNAVGVYNRGGVSMGTTPKPISFTVEIGLADVFLTNAPWIWDRNTNPHFGNSPLDSRVPTWTTSVDPSAQADVYDDILTFNTDGSFQLDTGAGGKVWVNEEATQNRPEWGPSSTSPALRDFVQPANSNWRWEIVTEAGQPNPLLVFSGGAFPSYVASDSYDTDKYEIMVLDANTLYLRVAYEWGAFYMRFTHPRREE